VDVHALDDPEVFLHEAGPLLLEDEARHNLALGIASTVRDDPSLYPDHAFWIVRAGTEVIGAALRTRPYNLVLARPRHDDALDALAADVDDDLPGVVGAMPEAGTFAAAWAARRGRAWEQRMAQGIYALERVQPVPAVAGHMRPAVEDDRALLLDWLGAFAVEALHDESPDEERLADMVAHRLGPSATGLALWVDDGPVSLAGFGSGTPNGVRIGPVYTPPELRGRGYASALVAELSAQQLAAGRSFCFLYTDLANPTSNKIYERIGYERVCDSAEIAFT
jgi:hypothetical protein